MGHDGMKLQVGGAACHQLRGVSGDQRAVGRTRLGLDEERLRRGREGSER